MKLSSKILGILPEHSRSIRVRNYIKHGQQQRNSGFNMLRKFFDRSTPILMSLIFVLGVCSRIHAQDEDIDQRWQGILDAGGAKLTLNIEITRAGDTLSGTIFSVEQNNAAIPLSKVSIDEKTVILEAATVQATFRGEIDKDGALAIGTWTQMGREFDLTINKVDSFEIASTTEHIEMWVGVLDVGIELETGLKIFQDDEGTLTAKMDSYDQAALNIPVNFERDGDTYKMWLENLKMEYEATLNEDKTELTGTFKQAGREFPLVLKKKKLDYTPTKKRPQTPKEPFPYASIEVEIPNTQQEITLSGTLTLPEGEGPFPAAILITGSGPQDRDETILGHKPFLVIADHLSRNGIAVLRYDERGVGKSTGVFATATSADLAKDVVSVLDYLQTQEKINKDKVGLIGHSEGGLIAPIVAASRPDVGFVVMLAGTGVNGGAILESQSTAMLRAAGIPEAALKANQDIFQAMHRFLKANPEATAQEVSAACKTVADKLEEGPLRSQTAKSAEELGNMVTTPWMRYFILYDPAENLAKVSCPLLAMNGEKDLQILIDLNFEAIEKALQSGGNPHYDMVRFPNMNHLFQETDGTGMPTEYGSIDQTFSPKALKVMTDWINQKMQ